MATVTICEMSPRDGLQILNRSRLIPMERRLQLIEKLQESGLEYIEVGSFVNPKHMPAMADTLELAKRLRSYRGQLAALVPTARYFQAFAEAAPPLTTVAIFLSASEAYSLKNTGRTSAQALEAASEVAALARQRGYRLRAHLSGAFRDLTPENRPTPEKEVMSFCRQLLDMDCEVVALADTDGTATTREIEQMLKSVKQAVGLERISVHLHDRYGWGLVNALRAYEIGVRVFDTAVGGIGGNRAVDREAAGNLATEELVSLFHSMDVETGLNLDRLVAAGEIIYEMTQLVGDPPPPSKVLYDRLLSQRRPSGQ